MATRAAEHIGRVLGGRYRLMAPLGTGASAQVFLADDVRLRRRVAVKILHPALAEDPSFLRRFRAEARAAAALSHPHVMSVYDWGEDDGPFLVMEHLGGGSLRGILDSGARLTPSQALEVGLQAARGLDYAHRRGFVHRDIKPANLLFDDEGRLCIADFGLARALAEAGWTEPDGALVGTARYASPEQAEGEPVDGRSDVYSLALVLVESVTGKVPFASDTTVATLRARIGAKVPLDSRLGPLASAIERAARPDAGERADAAGMAKALLGVATKLPRPERIPLVRPTETFDPAEAEIDRTLLPPPDPEPEPEPEPAPVVVPEPGDAVDGDAPASGPAVAAKGRRVRGWIIALVVVLALAAGAAGTWAALYLTTPSYPVPDVVGRTELEAQRAVADRGWRVEIRHDRRDGTAPGDVLGQQPAAGQELRQGATLVVTVSDGPTLVDVPDLGGKGSAESIGLLQQAELDTVLVKPDYNETVPLGTVMSWWSEGRQLAPGDQLPKGSPVDLVISAGPAPRPVPEVVGIGYDSAAATLEAAGLPPVRTEVYSSTAKGVVVSTNPPAGTVVPRDTSVTVAVSKGIQLVSVPSVRGKSLSSAISTLENAGLVAGRVTGSARGTVVGTSPAAGEKVEPGSTVNITLG